MRSAEERDVLEFTGTVARVARGFYVVDAIAGPLRREVLCTLSGRLKQNHIKITPGDEVTVEVSPFDLRRGRISRIAGTGGNVRGENRTEPGFRPWTTLFPPGNGRIWGYGWLRWTTLSVCYNVKLRVPSAPVDGVRMLSLSKFAVMSADERRHAVAELGGGPPNGVRIAAEVSELERRYEMTSETMREHVRRGELDTADTARWLVLLDALGR